MEKLIISASGGRTSMYLAVWAKLNMSHLYDISFIFANTGQEMDETLDFIDRVDKKWNLGVVWVEAVTHHNERKGCTYSIVTHATACRNGDVFEEVIKKYGIPNKAYPHCNRELKLNPMMNWRRDNATGAHFAVGIRVDEIDRMSKKAERDRIIYPLISINPMTKKDIIEWWKNYPEIDLRIPEHHGNCKACWKKTNRKLLTIAIDTPEFFEFPDRMEQLHHEKGANDDSRVFFRGNRSAREVVGEAHLTKFNHFTDPHHFDFELDTSNGCSESCDVFTEDTD